MNKQSKNKAGFTLVEVLLVIGIIAILASVVIIAINPGKQMAQSRNVARLANLNAIVKATEQYLIDNKGTLPASITTNWQSICKEGVASSTCASNGLLYLPEIYDNQTYLAKLPTDPSDKDQYSTGYQIRKTIGNRIQAKALWAELGETIDTVGGGTSSGTACVSSCVGSCDGLDNCGNNVCGAPTTPTVTNVTAASSSTQIILTWDSVPEADSYQICQSTNSTTCTTSFTPTVTSTINNITRTGLTNGTTYYFTVKAVTCTNVVSASPSTQISAVPAALNACTATTRTTECTSSNTYGDICGGGYLFCKNTGDAAALSCGNANLVASPALDMSGNCSSSNDIRSRKWDDQQTSGQARYPAELIGTNDLYDGRINIATMKASAQASDYFNASDPDLEAAAFCDNLVVNGFSDWYLPSKAEVCSMIRSGKYCESLTVACSAGNGQAAASTALNGCTNTSPLVVGLANTDYWSSTEYSISEAWRVRSYTGADSFLQKSINNYVRCVRRF